MPLDQFVGLAVNVVVYLALIALVLYRQMSAQPLRARTLVLMPMVLGLLGLLQLGRQPSLQTGSVQPSLFSASSSDWPPASGGGLRSRFGPMPAG